jgi:hypothetical protein
MPDEETIAREVEAFYQRYIEAWNGRDPAEIASCYDRPHVGLSGEHAPSVVSTDAEPSAGALKRWPFMTSSSGNAPALTVFRSGRSPHPSPS